MTRNDTKLVRESLLRTLRASRRPMSTSELAGQMPWRREVLSVSCELLCNAPAERAAAARERVRVVECHQSWHVVETRRTAQDGNAVYRHLANLAKEKLVRRIVLGPRRVTWEAL